jgi:hypothetical protein
MRLEAEIIACCEGLELSLQHSQLPIVVEYGCLQLVLAISAKSQDRSSFQNTTKEIQLLASGTRVCKFVKVDRSQVRISHCMCLANWARE